MSLESSRKILKVIGILCIIFGIFQIISAALLLFGGKAASQSGEVAISAEEMRLLTIGSIFYIVTGVVTFLQGVFSVRAAKNFNKIMPAWIFAIIGLVFSIIEAVYSIINSMESSSIISSVVSIALAILVFAAANNIKKSVGK